MHAIALIVLYCLVVVMPLLVISIVGGASKDPFLFDFGRCLALAAFGILALQPVLSSRAHWIERPFGFDIVSRFHKIMGVFAAVLLLAHPLLLAAGGAGIGLLISLDLPWYIWVGKGTLVLLLVQAVIGMYWERLGLSFESWRCSHYIIAPFIIMGGFTHSWAVGTHLSMEILQAWWIALLAVAVFAFVYHKLIKPSMLRRSPWEVTSVTQETHDVWTVRLSPPARGNIPDYMPGQFHFVTFLRDPSLPVEEHHWTISSSPAQKEYVSSTIKESGDFTSTIGRTKPGDKAIVESPFGRFSYVLHPEDKDIVFISGGIGITPIMAMLRHMRDVNADIQVLLIFANKTRNDMVFGEELESLEAADKPNLKVVPVLSNPDEDRQGETGYVDADLLKRYCGENLQSKAYYVCGPPIMADKVFEALHSLGVSDDRIRSERFSL